MITVAFHGNELKGNINLPSSKSISNRALIIRAIKGNAIEIAHLSSSEDTVMLQSLLESNKREMACGDGGTTFRFLLALLCLQGREHMLSGSERLQQRPVKSLVDALNDLGASIEYLKHDGFPPLQLHPSALHGGRIDIDASVSSQFISALMMIAPALPEGITLNLKGSAVSEPYIRLTQKIMEYFGINVISEHDCITIQPSEYTSGKLTVEADWSAAAFWFEAVALVDKADIFLEGLSLDSMQGDAVIATMCNAFEISVKQEQAGVRIIKDGSSRSKKAEHSFVNYPDLVPPFIMMCTALNIPCRCTDIASLRLKESDRIESLKSVMQNMEAKVISGPDWIEYCSSVIKAPVAPFDVFGDHRMAMCLAPLSIKLGKISISNQEVVSKSYPGFWDDLASVGFEIRPVSEF